MLLSKPTALSDEHARMVLGICRLLLREPHEAEDAAQQAFLSAHGALLSGTTPLDPARWLSAIARNECRSRIVRCMATPLARPVEEVPAPAGDAADEAGRREAFAEVKSAVAGLPPRQREAIVLYGLSYDEVTASLDVTRPIVEALLVRGAAGCVRPYAACRGTPSER